MMRHLLEILSKNNTSVIVVVFTFVVLLLIFLIARSFREENSDVSTQVASRATSSVSKKQQEVVAPVQAAPVLPKEDSPLDDIDNLDELMGPTDPIAAVPASSGSSAETSVPTAGATAEQNADYQKTLTEREKIIGDLKTEIAGLQEKMKVIPDTGAMEQKIKELTDKLSEYEIIEDDIANLSFYKAENAKLKDELAKLKGTSVNEVAKLAEEATTTVQMQSLETADPVIPQAPVAVSSSPEPTQESVTMKEFEQAVEQKENLEKTLGVSSSSVAPVVAAAADADIMKEFENVVAKELGSEPPAPTTPIAPPVEAAATPTGDVIAEIDSSKLMSEMESLAAAPVPESKDDGKDSSQKLIEEFENFVNKA